jgi:hypothetical protein
MAAHSYNSAPAAQLYKLQVLQNHALRVITGARKYTNLKSLHIECGTLELNFAREANQLKYWARTVTQGASLPTHEKITEDPAYVYAKNKKIPLPYVQNVQSLVKEYQLDASQIENPVHFSLSTLSRSDIDFRLSEVINKSDHDPTAGSIAKKHITKHYSEFTRIFSDGSKNPEENTAGGAYIIHNPDGTIAHFSSVRYLPEISIYSCELAIIKDITTYIRKLANHSSAYVIISDSLSALRSLYSGHSKSRPGLVYNTLIDVSALERERGSY